MKEGGLEEQKLEKKSGARSCGDLREVEGVWFTLLCEMGSH